MGRLKQTAPGPYGPKRRCLEKRSSNRSKSFDNFRFTSFENSEWFNMVREKRIIVERSLHPEIDAALPDVRAAFRKLGWGPILDLQGPYCPDLVREFYANIEDKQDAKSKKIQSFVRGKSILLATDTLADLLGVKKEGGFFVCSTECIASDTDYEVSEGESRLGYTRQSYSNRSSTLTGSIPILDRVICAFLNYNVIPRVSGQNELRVADVYFLSNMLVNETPTKIPFATIVMGHIRWLAKHQKGKFNLPYPLILQKLFVQENVNFEGALTLSTTPSDIFSPSSMKDLFYIRYKGIWYKNPLSTKVIQHKRDPILPTSYFVENKIPLSGQAALDQPVVHRQEPPRSAERTSSGAAAPRNQDSSQRHCCSHSRAALSLVLDCFDTVLQRLDDVVARQDKIEDMYHESQGRAPPPQDRAPSAPVDRSILEHFDDDGSDSSLPF